MRLHIRLSDVFGASFPDCREEQHLMALRGYLISMLKSARERNERDRSARIQGFLDEVTGILRDDYRYDDADLRSRRAPRDLFDHYYNNVSRDWKLLADMRP